MSPSGPDAALVARAPAHARVMPAGTGETVYVLADSATVKVGLHDSAGTIALAEVTLAPHGGVPAHTNAGEDETLYVLDGALHVRVGDERVTLGVGGCVFAPRGTVHAYINPCPALARVLVISSPAPDASRLFVELAAGFAAGGIGGRPSSAPDDAGHLAHAFRRLAAARGMQLLDGAADHAAAPAAMD